jgi:hypothetical protein
MVLKVKTKRPFPGYFVGEVRRLWKAWHEPLFPKQIVT